jgi:phosphomannomutase
MGLEDIFRAYDIRGVFGEEFTAEVASKIGLTFGNYVGPGKRICLGMDTRASSPQVEDALSKGLAESGCNVTCIGAMPIPAANFTTLKRGFDFGIFITASHNPPEYNGIRFRKPDGTGFTYQNQEIKQLFFQGELKPAHEKGAIEHADNKAVVDAYCDFLVQHVKAERGMKITIDPMHGASSITARRTMEALGHEVHSVSESIDPTFGGRDPHPRPGVLGLLEEKVKETRSDFGVAFDPDGDRAVFVDDKARAVQVEVMGIILARDVLREKGGGMILANVPCSMILEDEIAKAGGEVCRTRVGDVFVCEAMKEKKAILGMEISAHFFLPTYYYFDDPLLVTLRLAQILARDRRTLSRMVDEIPTFPALEKGFTCPDNIKFKVIDEIRKDFEESGAEILTIDGVKVLLENGWALLRGSNTQPLIRLFAEARTQKRLDEIVTQFEEILQNKMDLLGS